MSSRNDSDVISQEFKTAIVPLLSEAKENTLALNEKKFLINFSLKRKL